MNKKKPIEILQHDVEIPEVVQNKIDGTLLKIKDESKVSKIVRYDSRDTKSVTKKSKRRFGLVAAIAALTITTMSVGAAVYMNWSKGLEESLHVEEAQKHKLEENKTATFQEQVAMDQGITVTATQSITDNYYTYIAFKVEGFDMVEGEQPDFEHTNATIEGIADEDVRAIGGFYDGTTTGPDGMIVNADGTSLNEVDGMIIPKYNAEDGSMEYHLTMYSLGAEESLLNKSVHIELENLGTVAKAEYANKVTGKWVFDIDLQGSDEVREATVNVPLGDTGATVIGAEISPISIGATLNFPRQTEISKISVDEATQIALAAGIEVEDVETTEEFPVDPPMLCGVKMKDGTLYPYLYMGSGIFGYSDENSDAFYMRSSIDRILDTNEVEALLFQKEYAGDGVTPTEDNFYVVPIS